MQIFDPVRRKWVACLPEETVRQLFIQYCIATERCTFNRIGIERKVEVHGLMRRYDLVLFDTTGEPWLLAECKSPDVQITQQTLDQIARYNLSLRVPYLVVTNGIQTFCVKVDLDAGSYTFEEDIPNPGAIDRT